jgi:hypothetical protein
VVTYIPWFDCMYVPVTDDDDSKPKLAGRRIGVALIKVRDYQLIAPNKLLSNRQELLLEEWAGKLPRAPTASSSPIDEATNNE